MKGSRMDHVETFDAGEVIVAEGDLSREMFVIQSGTVEVTKRVDGREVRLATLERGAFFGEMSLLEGLPRHATIRAIGEVRLVVIEPGSLLLRIRRDPTFAFEMLQQLSGRVRSLGDRLMTLLHTRELEPDTITASGEPHAPVPREELPA